MHQPEPVGLRVLHLTQPVDGGVARVVTDLARAQLAAGLRVTVACPDSALTGELRSLGADVRRWEATRSPGASLPGEVRRLARVVDEVRPALVHAHSAKAGLAGRLAVRGRIPTVFQPHTSRAAQRAPNRSQFRARAATAPPTASKDQACGWNTVGIRPRTASRPASPAFALCACTNAGRTSSTTRASRRTSPGREATRSIHLTIC